MSASGPYDFVYVHTTIPEGMTVREWRAQRAAERTAAEAAAKAERRARRRAALVRTIGAMRIPLPQVHLHRRGAHR